MPQTLIETRHTERWTLNFFSMTDDDGEWIGTLCELVTGHRRVGLISTTRRGVGQPLAVDHLFARAASWIKDYEQRPHTGETDFGELSD